MELIEIFVRRTITTTTEMAPHAYSDRKSSLGLTRHDEMTLVTPTGRASNSRRGDGGGLSFARLDVASGEIYVAGPTSC